MVLPVVFGDPDEGDRDEVGPDVEGIEEVSDAETGVVVTGAVDVSPPVIADIGNDDVGVKVAAEAPLVSSKGT